MSPIKGSERQELFESLQELSAFFNKKRLHFEGQSREKGFDVSEFAEGKIVSAMISKSGVKLLPAEKRAIFEVFLGKREITSLESLRLMSAFRRVCFEIARHDQFIVEQSLRRQHIKLNNLLKNRLSMLWMKVAEIYKPSLKKASFDHRKSIERIKMERNPVETWKTIKILESLAKSLEGKEGMKKLAMHYFREAKRLKLITAKAHVQPVLSEMQAVARKLKPRPRRGRR